MTDLIDRQAAIEAFEKELSAKHNRRELAISFVGIKSILEKLPSAQPEIVRGQWINHGSFVTCSVCNEEQYGIDTGRFYCPNCGAKMEVEND